MSGQSQLTITSQDTAGNAITGYWTVLYGSHGQELATGYTSKTFSGLTSGTTYSVELDSYANCQFSHWQDNGNTMNVRSFTAKGSQTFVGVYTCSSTTTKAVAGGGQALIIAGSEGLVSTLVLISLALAAFSVTVVTARTERKTGVTS